MTRSRPRPGWHPSDMISEHATRIEQALSDMRLSAIAFECGEDLIHRLASEISTLAHDLKAVTPSLRIVTTIERAA